MTSVKNTSPVEKRVYTLSRVSSGLSRLERIVSSFPALLDPIFLHTPTWVQREEVPRGTPRLWPWSLTTYGRAGLWPPVKY